MNTFLMASAALLAATVSGQAGAVTLGDTVTCNQSSSLGFFSCSTASATVGAGPEFGIGSGGASFITADFGDGALTLNFTQAGALGGTVIDFTDVTKPIASFGLLSFSGINGFDASDVSLSNGLLSINLIGTDFSQGAQINLSLGAVPEPATWGMMLLGFGLAGAAVRSRRVRFATA